eukprot:TRINITY_DN12327_c0_g1_i1.p1 TRINITY_DN12327_c0_g1~~TRINITY_DN12327_c0_g1_i1.p1  ORF type:complete len:109 (-),score=28.10 TRINITY_DN12327_c0_g1_i1:97-423(-)
MENRQRKKIALAQGFGLYDWYKLRENNKNMSGIEGERLVVTKEELKKHDNENDAWISINNKVYNITEYVKYHPGGKQILMDVSGKDATKTFLEYHKWVNYEFILENKY